MAGMLMIGIAGQGGNGMVEYWKDGVLAGTTGELLPRYSSVPSFQYSENEFAQTKQKNQS
jgi:hypothetical protein